MWVGFFGGGEHSYLYVNPLYGWEHTCLPLSSPFVVLVPACLVFTLYNSIKFITLTCSSSCAYRSRLSSHIITVNHSCARFGCASGIRGSTPKLVGMHALAPDPANPRHTHTLVTKTTQYSWRCAWKQGLFNFGCQCIGHG